MVKVNVSRWERQNHAVKKPKKKNLKKNQKKRKTVSCKIVGKIASKSRIFFHFIIVFRFIVEDDEDFDSDESEEEGSGKGKKTGSAKKSRVSVRNRTFSSFIVFL